MGRIKPGPSAQTDGQGWAQTEFQVGWQPGDNYRIFAHGLVSFSDGFTGVFDVEAKQGDDTQARLRYRRGAKEFVNANFYSPLLTRGDFGGRRGAVPRHPQALTLG